MIAWVPLFLGCNGTKPAVDTGAAECLPSVGYATCIGLDDPSYWHYICDGCGLTWICTSGGWTHSSIPCRCLVNDGAGWDTGDWTCHSDDYYAKEQP